MKDETKSRTAKPPAKAKGAVPEVFAPTQEQRFAVAMLSDRMSQDDLAKVVFNPETGKPINRKTLKKHFNKELREGKNSQHAALLGKLHWHVHKKNHPGMLAFALKTQFGYRENARPDETVATADPEALAARIRQTLAQMDELTRGSNPTQPQP